MKLRFAAIASLCALSWVGARPDATGAAPKPTSSAAHMGSPPIAILVGEPLGTSSKLYVVSIDADTSSTDAALGTPTAKLEHIAGAAVAAVTSRSGPPSVFAIASGNSSILEHRSSS